MIDFSASACMFEFRINDVPVLAMRIDGQASTSVPINYSILEKGKQKISLKILPLLGQINLDEKADVSYDIKLFEVSNGFQFQQQSNDYKSPKITSKLPAIINEDIFEANIPYKLDAWQDSSNLNKVKDIKTLLMSEYDSLINIISAQQYDLFKKKMAEREYNMAKSMYLSPIESSNRIDSIIKDFKNGFKIMPIPKDAVLLLCASGKTAMLKKPDGDSALYAYNEKTEEELYVDVMFHQKKGAKTLSII